MSTKAILIWLLVFSVLVVLANDLIFANTPEIIEWGDELGQIAMEQDETVGEVLYRVGVLQVQPDLDRLMVYMKFLSTEHIRLLDAIRDSRFFDMTGAMMGSKLYGNDSLSVRAKDILEFFAAVKALEEYNQKYFALAKSKKER